jgi:hypothetical protein
MAQQLYQLAEVQQTFAVRIRAKVQSRRDHAQSLAEDVPLLGWLLRPLTGMAFDARESSNTARGERGEALVLRALLHGLPDTWRVFHGVVVEPQPDIFAQIDLLLVSSAGLFLVETKAWRGSYKGYRDTWQQREGRVWATIDSPTAQVQRQARKLASWFDQQCSFALPTSFKRCITPFVVFTQPQWLRASQCSVEVFAGTRPLIQALLAQQSQTFTADQVALVCDLLIRSPAPISLPAVIEPGNKGAEFDVSREDRTEVPLVPVCPNCGVSMVLRTARQGANAGNTFYGCPNYPRCRAVLPSGR